VSPLAVRGAFIISRWRWVIVLVLSRYTIDVAIFCFGLSWNLAFVLIRCFVVFSTDLDAFPDWELFSFSDTRRESSSNTAVSV